MFPAGTGYLLDVNWEKVCAVCTGACLPHAAVIILSRLKGFDQPLLNISMQADVIDVP